MLSEINPSSFALAIITDDVSKLVKIPGIGKKTAARIILELKDKLKSETAIDQTQEVNAQIEKNNDTKEAIAALQVLGYTIKEIEKVFEKIDTKNLGLEEIIKMALRHLGQS